jgi:hypothetical protein
MPALTSKVVGNVEYLGVPNEVTTRCQSKLTRALRAPGRRGCARARRVRVDEVRSTPVPHRARGSLARWRRDQGARDLRRQPDVRRRRCLCGEVEAFTPLPEGAANDITATCGASTARRFTRPASACRASAEPVVILALDPGTGDLGWALVASRAGRVAELELRTVYQDPDPLWRVHAHGVLWRDLIAEHEGTAIAAAAARFNPRRFSMAVGL